MASPLEGIRVLDLSRVLAGPFCTQILGDLGADVIKVERPGEGDDTRRWGPPFLKDENGNDMAESAYYLSCNRNKRSVTIDLGTPEGQEIIHALAAKSDILIHNFKVGSLDRHGLGFAQMHERHPHLIYTAISGFGQDGPMAHEAGYDLMAQAMGGLMAHTGRPKEEPMKTGVAISDVMTGLYAAVGTLAALNARQATGKGQLVDLSLLDVTLSSMTNLAQYFLTLGALPPRFGNQHSTIVPYQCFQALDGYMVVAIGNDHQFARFCEAIGKVEWMNDPRFSRNEARVANREILIPMIDVLLATHPVAEWVEKFRSINIPAASVDSIDQVFANPQIQARGMEIALPHPQSAKPVSLVGSPLHLSETPVTYRFAPPVMGQHTDEVLAEILGLDKNRIAALRDKNII